MEKLHVRTVDFPDGKTVRYAPVNFVNGYIQQLRQSHGLYRLWADDPDTAMAYIDQIEDDEVVRASLRMLGLAAAGQRNFEIVVDEKTHEPLADIVQHALRRIPDFVERRVSLCYAVPRGLALLHVTWEARTCRLGKDPVRRRWMVPTTMTEVNKKRLRLMRVSGNRGSAYWAIWEPQLDSFVIIEDRNKNPKAAIAVQDFVSYFNEQNERSAGYGEGVASTLAPLVRAKGLGVTYWAQLLERFGTPFFEYNFDVTKGALFDELQGGHMVDPYTRARKMAEQVEKWRARHVITLPRHPGGEGDELKIHEVGASSAATHKEFVEYVNGQIQLCILGSTMALSERQKGGSLGASGEMDASQDAMEQWVEYHRTRLGESLTTGLVDEFVRRNALNIRAAGLQMPERGDLRFEAIPQIEQDVEELTKRMDLAGRAGLEFGENWLRSTLNVPRVDPDDTPLTMQPGAEGAGGGQPGQPGAPPAAPAQPGAFSFARTRAHVPAWSPARGEADGEMIEASEAARMVGWFAPVVRGGVA